jgi:hypothetical protein
MQDVETQKPQHLALLSIATKSKQPKPESAETITPNRFHIDFLIGILELITVFGGILLSWKRSTFWKLAEA